MLGGKKRTWEETVDEGKKISTNPDLSNSKLKETEPLTKLDLRIGPVSHSSMRD